MGEIRPAAPNPLTNLRVVKAFGSSMTAQLQGAQTSAMDEPWPGGLGLRLRASLTTAIVMDLTIADR